MVIGVESEGRWRIVRNEREVEVRWEGEGNDEGRE